jgi:hypothetical protein
MLFTFAYEAKVFCEGCGNGGSNQVKRSSISGHELMTILFY